MRHSTSRIFRCVASAFAVLTLTACDSTTAPPGALDAIAAARVGKAPDAGSAEIVKALRGATGRYHSTQQAAAAGYEDTHECVAVPALGGMGVHWPNPDLVDPVFDPMQPEAMLYEPGRNGHMKLVAVEYIVIDVGQPRPSFAGHLFDVGGTPVPVPHWSLHVWLWKDNPSGMFAPFNPDVACP